MVLVRVHISIDLQFRIQRTKLYLWHFLGKNHLFKILKTLNKNIFLFSIFLKQKDIVRNYKKIKLYNKLF